jgi:hypothetical protein
MRIKYFKKKLVWFTENDYQKILARFNFRDYKKGSCGEFESSIGCPLCRKYNLCEKCQLNKFKKVSENEYDLDKRPCEQLITSIIRSKNTKFYIFYNYIGYDINNEKLAKKQLNKILSFLYSFDEVSIKEFRSLKNES